jgi:hypothetical protein
MPKKKKISGEVVSGSAKIPVALYNRMTPFIGTRSGDRTRMELINEGLELWIAMHEYAVTLKGETQQIGSRAFDDLRQIFTKGKDVRKRDAAEDIRTVRLNVDRESARDQVPEERTSRGPKVKVS